MGIQKWEYKIISAVCQSPETELKLNQLGDEGWELVSSSSQGNALMFGYVFKRPKP
jgi:hypothetical protein